MAGIRQKNHRAIKFQAFGLRTGRIEWPTIWLIASCYGIWFVAGLWLWPSLPLIALVLMGLAVALHSSLMHEVLHGHPTRNRWINEMLVCLPIGLIWPYRRFKSLHLHHHRDESLTDPFDDPESYYHAKWRYERMPAFVKTVLRLNNNMILRTLLGPVLGVVGLLWSDVSAIIKGDKAVASAWLIHMALAVPAVWLLVSVFAIPLWLYVLVPVWVGHGLIAIRTFAEHQWSENSDGRSIIVEKTILSFLFLNNNLHIVHHENPTIAWYELPTKYWSDRDGWLAKNGHYVYPTYWSMFRRYAFKLKEPVVHPVWRKTI